MHQDELPLSSVKAHRLFPGRTTLRVAEVANALAVTEQHVIDLITEGKLVAINVAGVNRTDRAWWRIPVDAWDRYVTENCNLHIPAQQHPQLKFPL